MNLWWLDLHCEDNDNDNVTQHAKIGIFNGKIVDSKQARSNGLTLTSKVWWMKRREENMPMEYWQPMKGKSLYPRE